jgi:hypothetical protein
LSALIGLVASRPGSGVGVVSGAALADAVGEEALGEASAERGAFVGDAGAHAPNRSSEAAALAARARR